MKPRFFGIAFTSDWSVSIKFRKSTCCGFIFRILLVENRTDSSWSADSFASDAWLRCGWFRCLKTVRLRCNDAASFNRNWDDKFSRRFFNRLLIRWDCWRGLHEWLSGCCVRFVWFICRLTWKGVPLKEKNQRLKFLSCSKDKSEFTCMSLMWMFFDMLAAFEHERIVLFLVDPSLWNDFVRWKMYMLSVDALGLERFVNQALDVAFQLYISDQPEGRNWILNDDKRKSTRWHLLWA